MFDSKKTANGWFSYPPVQKQANGRKKLELTSLDQLTLFSISWSVCIQDYICIVFSTKGHIVHV
jgi:hypothetical protein